MSYIKRKYEAWWQKYNYILSTGLNAGIAFSSIIIFFAVMYHAKDINWWGNSVMYEGMDGSMTGWLNATVDAPDGYFGPRIGHFLRVSMLKRYNMFDLVNLVRFIR